MGEKARERAEKRVNELKSGKDNLSAHGYWDLGYYEGKVAEIEYAIEFIDKLLG